MPISRAFVQLSELGALLSALGVRLTEPELRVAAASLDADGNGGIDFDEFFAWYTSGGDSAEDVDDGRASGGSTTRSGTSGLPMRSATGAIGATLRGKLTKVWVVVM